MVGVSSDNLDNVVVCRFAVVLVVTEENTKRFDNILDSEPRFKIQFN